MIRLASKEEQKMIVLNVTYKCKPDMREEFLEMIMAEGLDVASRAEAGNIKYDYYIPTDSDDELLLVEKWADQEALAFHGAQPHFKRLGKMKAAYVNETIIEKYVSE
ncbi:MAG: antibiotic biosynthesis monooxygenase [Firmicutes bacterium]|nr:antibiotic biosynthesis monooxygenase [Bacillota bacterium]